MPPPVTAPATQPAQPELAAPVSHIEIPIPDVSQLIIQDDTPVDNLLHEKQMRLLTEPLYTSWKTEKPFLALANVGLFHEPRQTPVVPDVMLSTEVAALPEDWREHKEHLSYFVWERGKVPDVVIEIVSNTKGQELGAKMERYARLHVPFYVVYDPEHHIQEQTLTCHVLLGTEYDRFPEPLLFKKLGIGLKLWQGIFENQEGEWLRWTDPAGEVIPTGAELAAREARRAEAAERRAAEEAERAEAAERRLAELEARLKAMEK
jgi:Uma2 family endonuclease